MDVFDARTLNAWPEPAASDLVPLPDASTWVNVRTLGAKGDGASYDTEAFRSAIASVPGHLRSHRKYIVTDTLLLRPDTVLIGLHPSATQLVVPDRTAAFQGIGPPDPLLDTPKGGTNVVIGIGLYTNGINPRAVAARWRAGAQSMMNDVRFLGGHGTNGLDGKRENPYNSTHSGDPDPARRWDSQYPSLWVTDGGGGTFFDLWTPSTFAQAGMLVSDTSTSGRVYQISSEHHVRYEVQMKRAANWEIYALQTEGERGESGFSSALEIDDSSNITVANMHMYRVISSNQPFPYAIRVADSHDIRFRNIHSYSNSKVAYDATVFDSARTHRASPARIRVAHDRAVGRIAGHRCGRGAASRLRVRTRRWVPQHLRRRGLAVRRFLFRRREVESNLPLVGSRAHADDRRRRTLGAGESGVRQGRSPARRVVRGKGTVYAIDPDGTGEMKLLTAEPSAPRPAMTAVVPSGDWRLQRDPRASSCRARTSSCRRMARRSSQPRRGSWRA